MVIYADVLFIINFFITFLLLKVTARFSKKHAPTWRLMIGAVLGGAYAMIIFVVLPAWLSVLSKILAAVVIVLAAFSFYRVRSFLLTLGIFIFANSVFLGVMIALCLLLKTPFIAVNNSTVYYNVSAGGLLAAAFLAYLLSCGIVRWYNRRLAQEEIYLLEIENANQKIKLYAFADTGNRLREPFSDAPVIIVKDSLVQALVGDSQTRLIPVTTVNRSSLLTGFRPQRVTVQVAGHKEVIENAYVALSDELNHSAYSAIIPPEILSA